MMTRNNSNSTSTTQRHSDWDFLRPASGGVLGVIIGLIFASFLGWI